VHLAGKNSAAIGLRVLAGERMTVEFSPYDLTKGRIAYRHE
jgi:translation initiation factor IF-1